MINLLEWLFGCQHDWGFPITTDRKQGAYQRCTKCGQQRNFNAEKWEVAA